MTMTVSLIEVLSQELIDEIIDRVALYLVSSPVFLYYLKDCALVCKAFLPRSQTHIFKVMNLWTSDVSRRNARISALRKVLEKNNRIATHFREVVLLNTDDGFQKLLDHKNLKAILALINKPYPRLERLSLQGGGRGYPDDMGKLMTRLFDLFGGQITSLSLLHFKRISPGIFLHLPALRDLTLENIELLPSDNRDSLHRIQSKRLRLKTLKCQRSIDFVAHLSQDMSSGNPIDLTHLEKLHADAEYREEVECAYNVVQIASNSLQAIQLTVEPGRFTYTVDPLDGHFGLDKCTKLRILEIDMVPDDTGDIFLASLLRILETITDRNGIQELTIGIQPDYRNLRRALDAPWTVLGHQIKRISSGKHLQVVLRIKGDNISQAEDAYYDVLLQISQTIFGGEETEPCIHVVHDVFNYICESLLLGALGFVSDHWINWVPLLTPTSGISILRLPRYKAAWTVAAYLDFSSLAIHLTSSTMESYKPTPGPLVAIIGAGFGGIITAVYLKEKLGFTNFLIFEKDADVGGTWRDNVYPGARCDIGSHFYSLSTDLKHDWDDVCPDQPTILAYIKSVVAKHGLMPHIHLNTRVVSAEWDAAAQIYDVKTQKQDAKGSVVPGGLDVKANAIVSACGILHIPKMPDIKGLDTFKGTLMHSAKWDQKADLRNKRVAVIGNGSTGAQLLSVLPEIEGVKITHFFRTPGWTLPYVSGPIPRLFKFMFTKLPFATRLYRWFMFWTMNELIYHLVFKYKAMRAPMMKFSRSLMTKAAPEKYHDLVIPKNFPVGCRRPVYNDGHLKNYHRENVDIRINSIKELTPEGILTNEGETLPFDIIICATGFVSDSYPIPIRGREGLTVQEYYDKTGGPNAFLGISVPGFPNFGMLAGPNTATGFTSVLFFEEAQMNYISQMIKPVLDGTASSVELTKVANDAYNHDVQEKLKDSVHSVYGSWYVNPVSKRNFAVWPGSGFAYWWACYSVNWNHYTVSGLKGTAVGLNKRSTLTSVAIAAAGLGLAAVYGRLGLAALGA